MEQLSICIGINEVHKAVLPPGYNTDKTLIFVISESSADTVNPLLTRLVSQYPEAQLIGCSSSGDIFENDLAQESIVVHFLRFDRAQIRLESTAITDIATSERDGFRLAHSLSGPDLKAILVLSDADTVNGAAFVSGVSAACADVIAVGGLAGITAKNLQPWTIVNGRAEAKQATAVGLYGDSVEVGYGSAGGWTALGPQRIVTKSSGATVYELDGRPALEIYKSYLGELANELPGIGMRFPLSIRLSNDDEYLMRTVLDTDELSQSIRYAGDVPQGCISQLMSGNLDRLIEGAAAAGRDAAKYLSHQGNSVALAVSCVGRRLVLRERTAEELEAVSDALGGDVPVIGFYSYGEVSPRIDGKTEFHNQTMTIAIISER